MVWNRRRGGCHLRRSYHREILESLGKPATVEEMREKEEDVIASIMEPLSQLRSRVGGDVLPLTIFMMTHCICRGIFFTAFDDKESWSPYRELLVLCLSDVGIDGEDEAQKFGLAHSRYAGMCCSASSCARSPFSSASRLVLDASALA